MLLNEVTSVNALVTLFDAPGKHVHANLGGTAPTCDVTQKMKDGVRQDISFMDYRMQLARGRVTQQELPRACLNLDGLTIRPSTGRTVNP